MQFNQSSSCSLHHRLPFMRSLLEHLKPGLSCSGIGLFTSDRNPTNLRHMFLCTNKKFWLYTFSLCLNFLLYWFSLCGMYFSVLISVTLQLLHLSLALLIFCSQNCSALMFLDGGLPSLCRFRDIGCLHSVAHPSAFSIWQQLYTVNGWPRFFGGQSPALPCRCPFVKVWV